MWLQALVLAISTNKPLTLYRPKQVEKPLKYQMSKYFLSVFCSGISGYNEFNISRNHHANPVKQFPKLTLSTCAVCTGSTEWLDGGWTGVRSQDTNSPKLAWSYLFWCSVSLTFWCRSIWVSGYSVSQTTTPFPGWREWVMLGFVGNRSR